MKKFWYAERRRRSWESLQYEVKKEEWLEAYWLTVRMNGSFGRWPVAKRGEGRPDDRREKSEEKWNQKMRLKWQSEAKAEGCILDRERSVAENSEKPGVKLKPSTWWRRYFGRNQKTEGWRPEMTWSLPAEEENRIYRNVSDEEWSIWWRRRPAGWLKRWSWRPGRRSSENWLLATEASFNLKAIQASWPTWPASEAGQSKLQPPMKALRRLSGIRNEERRKILRHEGWPTVPIIRNYRLRLPTSGKRLTCVSGVKAHEAIQ
jgi:hypothetical protein